MTANRDLKDFASLIEALHPWLNQIVVIGGWAYRLYRLHPLAQQLEYEPLATFDTDVAVPAHLPVAGPNMHECLECLTKPPPSTGERHHPGKSLPLAYHNWGWSSRKVAPITTSFSLLAAPTAAG